MENFVLMKYDIILVDRSLEACRSKIEVFLCLEIIVLFESLSLPGFMIQLTFDAKTSCED